MSGPRRAAFLDRDGVINRRPPEHDYVRSLEQFEWLPGAAEALAAIRSEGYALVVASNQRGVARGLVSEDVLEVIEAEIQTKLAEHGAAIDAFYYCPHAISDHCACRKPAPGLLLRAADELELDLPASTMIGDSESDVEAGRAARCHTIRLAPPGTASAADVVVSDLRAAADYLGQPRAAPRGG